jgi:hypothetical protein
MDGESLVDLKAAFDEWRRRKRHPRAAVPADLLQRACAAARHHGPSAVHRATKVNRGRLKVGGRSRSKRRAPVASVAAYSRVELAAPAAATSRLFAEVEMPTGLKVRLFAGTDEALGLLSSLLDARGVQ